MGSFMPRYGGVVPNPLSQTPVNLHWGRIRHVYVSKLGEPLAGDLITIVKMCSLSAGSLSPNRVPSF